MKTQRQKADRMKEIITHNEHETEAFGKELAKLISAPAVLCLYGELGAGKTALVRGLAEGMGLNCTVSSPIGWEDYLRRNAVLAVEWSENVEDAFDGSEIRIRFEKLSDTERRITVEGGCLC